jgi:hypothetical protein
MAVLASVGKSTFKRVVLTEAMAAREVASIFEQIKVYHP